MLRASSVIAIMLAIPIHAAAAQTTYYARSPLVSKPTVVAPATPAAPALRCTIGDPSAWTILMVPGMNPNEFVDTSVLTRVGAVADRNAAQQAAACEAAIRGSNRRQCIVQGQGGFTLDMYVTRADASFPVSVIDRDNSIVFEVVSCS